MGKTSPFYGLLRFQPKIYCSAECLGKDVPISVGGHPGTLTLPKLPSWKPGEKDPLSKPLVGPSPAAKWKRGSELMDWGIPMSYPTGDSQVAQGLTRFRFTPESLDGAVQEIYDAAPAWTQLLRDYITLLTARNDHATLKRDASRIELLRVENAKPIRIRSASPLNFTLTIRRDSGLRLDSLSHACELASSGTLPRLEYRLILGAYEARSVADYRKAILEAAGALEVALTTKLLDEFDRQGISYGEAILKKFRTLGGRIELAKIVGIQLPTEIDSGLVERRNEVTHKGYYPDLQDANKFMSAVGKALQRISPSLHE